MAPDLDAPMHAGDEHGRSAWTKRRLRVIPRTFGWRLALSVAVLIAVSFAITFVAVYRGTGSSLSHQIDTEISGDAQALSSMLAGSRSHSRAALRATAEHYVQSQPYTGSSTLLFALVPGTAPATNEPELFDVHAQPDQGETVSEQQAENVSAAKLQRARLGYSKLELPDVGHMRLLTRQITIPGGGRVIVGVGEPLASVQSAQAGVARAFILAGVLVLVCALIAAYVIGTRFSAPLRGMASVAARVDAGDLHPRIHEVRDPPEEVHVLAESFNHMLDRLTEAFAAQRAFVADASHELRTPLTVIRGQLELLASEREPSRSEVRRVSTLVQSEIARMSRLVEDMLLLAKAERAEFVRPQTFDLREYVDDLWSATRTLASRRFELAEVPAGTLRADPDRLAQALRNLISNAIEHTSEPDGLVRLSVSAVPREGHAERARTSALETHVRFTIDDDGAGIEAQEREQVFRRFHRTDFARDRRSGGAGLGLAIVQAIAQAHGGSASADQSPQRGARVTIEIPGFTPGAHAGSGARRQTGSAQPDTREPAQGSEAAASDGILAGRA